MGWCINCWIEGFPIDNSVSFWTAFHWTEGQVDSDCGLPVRWVTSDTHTHIHIYIHLCIVFPCLQSYWYFSIVRHTQVEKMLVELRPQNTGTRRLTLIVLQEGYKKK